MQVEELKEKISTMSAAELAEIEAFVRDLLNDRNDPAVPVKQGISFEDAAAHVRTDYAHLLHKLSQ
jgi:hypothetical protein